MKNAGLYFLCSAYEEKNWLITPPFLHGKSQNPAVSMLTFFFFLCFFKFFFYFFDQNLWHTSFFYYVWLKQSSTFWYIYKNIYFFFFYLELCGVFEGKNIDLKNRVLQTDSKFILLFLNNLFTTSTIFIWYWHLLRIIYYF